MKPEDKLIVSLDLDSEREIFSMLRDLKKNVRLVKIGIGPFTACGPALIDKIHTHTGLGVFLDLKFHDIPNTVAKAVCAAVRPGVVMMNCHALGGSHMMKDLRHIAAMRAQALGIPRPLILAVTILTSHDQKSLKQIGIHDSIEKIVVRLSRLAKDAGLDGVVCSPHEIAAIRDAAGGDFCIVTPGVRPAWAAAHDQKRVMTPRQALQAGADYIVIGRPITAAANPAAAVEKIIEEIRMVPSRDDR